jgi:DNA-directed RNA polymerase specialized sigma24 family protein
VRDNREQKTHLYFQKWAVEHWELVDRLAQRRFVSESLGQEAALFVMERLEKDEWKLLRGYRGSARLKTYFCAVVYNLLEDFARNKFGRVRPPLWLKKLGGIWLLLYRFMCLERVTFSEAVHLAADRYHQVSLDQVELMAERILGEIPTCGKTQYQEVALDEQLHGAASAQGSSQEVAEEREREQIMKGLHDHFFGSDPDLNTSKALFDLLGCDVDLKADERLLLTLHHVEGLSVAAAGNKLGLNRFQAHGKLRRLYGRLRKAFESAGCSQELQLLLDTKE